MMQTRRTVLATGLAGTWCLTGSAGAAVTRPRRIVSLNPCIDATLVHVADRDQIAALSHYSRVRQQSNIYDIALTLPQTRGTAEEVIARNPDLVLAGNYGGAATLNALSRLGIPSALFGVPNTIEESLAQVRDISNRVGQANRGERLIVNIAQAISSSQPTSGRRFKALIYQPNGFAAGQGTLISEMMNHAGFDNMAGRYRVGKWGNIPLERILSDPPEVLLSSHSGPAAKTWGERMMQHPALSALSDRMAQVSFDEKLLYCGGPVLIKTANALKQARVQALEMLS